MMSADQAFDYYRAVQIVLSIYIYRIESGTVKKSKSHTRVEVAGGRGELSKWVATTKCGHVFVYLAMPCTSGHGATCLLQKQDQNSFGPVPHCGMFDGGRARQEGGEGIVD